MNNTPAAYVDHQPLPRVDNQRLARILTFLELSFERDEAGLYFCLNEIQFSIHLHGPNKEHLIIRCDFPDFLPPYTSRKRLTQEVDRYNQHYLYPRGFTHYCSGGQLHVYGDVVMDYHAGASDHQLLTHICLGTRHAQQMYDYILDNLR